MRLAAAAALGFGLLTATPSLADCKHDGQRDAEGARFCRSGFVSVCSAGEMLRTVLTCPAHLGDPPPDMPAAFINVRAAAYRAGDVAVEFAFRLRAVCDGKHSCAIAGDTALLGRDPAPRQKGQFSIVYACVTGLGTVTKQLRFSKGTQQVLTCVE